MIKDWRLLLQLFWVFFKIGPVTFGGGYAMIPLIEREVVTNKKWIKSEEVTDMFALSGTAPGSIAINAATFIGYRISGVMGAIVAAVGVLLPTFIIVVALSMVFATLQSNPHVQAAFLGIRAAVVALIAYAGIKIAKTAMIDLSTILLVASMFILLFWLHWNPIIVIFTGGFCGIIISKIKEIRKKDAQIPMSREG